MMEVVCGIWGRESQKKRENNKIIALAAGWKCRDAGWQIQSRSYTPALGVPLQTVWCIDAVHIYLIINFLYIEVTFFSRMFNLPIYIHVE